MLPGLGFGDRALAPIPQQQSADMESVRIQSMDVLAEVVEAAADAVSDLGSITLADIEKLIKKTSLTKKDISDAIREALTQPVLPVRDSSVLVRSQVKAEDVKEAAKKGSVSSANKQSEPVVRGSSGGNSGSTGERGNLSRLYETYQKFIGLMDTATHRPLELLDRGVDLLAKGADKVFGGAGRLIGGAFKKEKKEDFFGSSGGDTFGRSGTGYQDGSDSFVSNFRSQGPTATVQPGGFGSIFGPGPGFVSDDFQTSSAQVESPFSFFDAAPDPFSGNGYGGEADNAFSGFFDPMSARGGVSTADNLAVDSMESDIRANNILFRTFDEPEKSDFGKFLDFQISGGAGVQGKSKDKGLLGTLVEGVVLAGLLFALPFIVDKVIPFIKGDLIPFIQGPFLEFMGVAGKVVGSAARAIWPFVSSALGAIGVWLDENKEGIWTGVTTAARAIGGWLSTSVWPAITTAAEAIGDWVKEAGPGIWNAITSAAVAIGNWVKEDGWPALTGFLKEFGTFIKDTLWPFLRDVGAPALGAHLVNNLGMLGDFLRFFSPGENKIEVLKDLGQRLANTVNLLTATIGSVARGAGELIAPGNSTSGILQQEAAVRPIIVRNNSGKNRGSTFYLNPDSGELYSLPSRYNTRNFESQGIITPTNYDWSYISDPSRFPISAATNLGVAPGLVSDAAIDESVRDAIITSDGQVIRTDPEDNIYAFKGDVSIAPAGVGGSGVSMAPANAMREFSGSPSGHNSQQPSTTNNVTNNYINQSNFNLSDLLPGSEFDPVGV
jgi:hypothetical protein